MDFSKRARCHWNCFGDGPPTRRLVVLLSLFVFANAAVLSAADATDFDLDGDSDIDDLNTLLARGPLVVGYIVEPGAMDPFDLTADGFVNDQDLAEWLVIAADVNELSLPYKEGDANWMAQWTVTIFWYGTKPDLRRHCVGITATSIATVSPTVPISFCGIATSSRHPWA